MAGDIQASSWRSGSISFGRFENEALCWERRSSFTHNRYLEEVEKYSKPGSVIEKKAYFEARLKRKALLRQSSYVWQSGTESQASEDEGPENTGCDGDFEHASEVGHSARFAEDRDGSAGLLKNDKYQVSENNVTEKTGYEGDFEHVNEFGHCARFDENHDRSIHLLENGKYQASENDITENTGYDGDFERLNEVGHSARVDESLDGSNNGDVEVTKYDGEGSTIFHFALETERATISSHLLQRVSENLEADRKDHLDAENSAYVDLVREIEVKEKLEGQASSMKFSSNSVDLSSNAHTAEKDGSVSSEPQRSSSLKVTTSSRSRDMKSRMSSQVNAANGKEKISKQAYKDIPRKPNRRHSDVSLTQKGKSPEATSLHLPPTARMPKSQVSSDSKANVRNQQKRIEREPRAKKVVASRALCTEKVRVHQSVNRDKQNVNSCKPGMKQNGSGFSFKSEERAKKRKEVKKDAEIKQLRRSFYFKATPMPAFYHECGRQSERNKELESKAKSSKSKSKRSAPGTTATRATDGNTVLCSGSAIKNSYTINEPLNADSANALEETNHPLAVLSDSSLPSASPTIHKFQQGRATKVVASRKEQVKRQVTNSPKQKEMVINKANRGFKAEEKTKVGAQSMGNGAMRQ